ncbi:hypothetical protein WD019_12040 [Fictibacillus sp. Mic-4]|uniref:hypothetical protein n=1 Tax=Fictibacillus sp. Mic-4 TaxID=3132826 RepID=UPI003CF281D0
MGLSLGDTSFAKFYKREGIKEGKEKGKQEVAVNLLELGVDLETIIKATGLTSTEIEKLKKK